jgi:mediator of RNA polymerase II transcription subunit 14
MPGLLLKMATDGAEGAKHAVNGKQSPAGAVQPADTGAEDEIPGLEKRASDNALTNGDVHIPGLGAYPTPNGVSPSSPTKAVIPASMYDLPEEIKHITAGQYSLGALIQRVSGECFNSLEEVIDELSGMLIQPAPPLTNGASSNQQPPALDPPQEHLNRRKKQRMLEFASEYRAKFIKLLVVSDWAKRDEKDVSKLIDLKIWLVEQDNAAQDAGNFFYSLIPEFRPWKITNPDIETALAVLSNGDVPWIPHFGYREQKTLSAEEVLKVLRQMNTMINLRIVLHEELIPQLRDYRVANGRATFTFPQEFELDVYRASEDPEQPWFFLDVRFLFEPAPQITGDQLRGGVDTRINLALSQDGLRGACELVHNFVLTHKINILLRQARELQRGIWASALGVELVRRVLVVQYWLESPQPKSWIEIGVVSGRDKSGRKKADNAISSQIKARWIRNGKEQKDVQIPMDLADLSIDRIVSAHIARHISYILENVRVALEASAANLSPGEQKSLVAELTTSETEPSDCALRVRIGEHPATTLQIDGITGRLYFSIAGPATPKAQEALERSKDPIVDAPAYLVRYLTYDIQMRIDRLAENVGWEPMRHVRITQDEVKTRTKRDVHRFALYQPQGFKGSTWYIMYTINLCGECWWALEV